MFYFLGTGGLCESWEAIEAKLEGNVHRGLWWDACWSEETDGWDGTTRQSLQGSISSEKLCKVDFYSYCISSYGLLLVVSGWKLLLIYITKKKLNKSFDSLNNIFRILRTFLNEKTNTKHEIYSNSSQSFFFMVFGYTLIICDIMI